MSFRDWLADTRQKFRREPPVKAARDSAREFWLGGLRRTAGWYYSGTPVWERDDWEVLCIMDACRHDVFREVCESGRYDWLPRRPGSIASVGSMSPEWISHTFNPDEYGREMSRTAYISGNPFTQKSHTSWSNLPVEETELAHLDEAWRTDWRQDDAELGISTIPPEALTERAIDVWRRRRDLGVDRMIIHYMQPHAPFRQRPEWFGTTRDLDAFGEPEKDGATKDIWHQLRDGHLDEDAFWRAYTANLEWGLDSVDVLRRNCDAAIAVSSDHGNGMGEWGTWSHPPGSPVPALRKVPWVTTNGRDEETVTPEINTEAESDVSIDDRLEALGYKETSA